MYIQKDYERIEVLQIFQELLCTQALYNDFTYEEAQRVKFTQLEF